MHPIGATPADSVRIEQAPSRKSASRSSPSPSCSPSTSSAPWPSSASRSASGRRRCRRALPRTMSKRRPPRRCQCARLPASAARRSGSGGPACNSCCMVRGERAGGYEFAGAVRWVVILLDLGLAKALAVHLCLDGKSSTCCTIETCTRDDVIEPFLAFHPD